MYKIPPFQNIVNLESLVSYLREIYYRKAQSDLIKAQVVSIPVWNMQTTASISVPYDTSIKVRRFVGFDAGIIPDDESEAIGAAANEDITSIKVDGSDIIITRRTGGVFDSAAFSSTAISRGNIILWYTT